jgi:GT2 family glycosyltransferase
MSRRYLFGPASADFAAQNLFDARQRGECLTFHIDGSADITIRPGENWSDLEQRLPADWRPDYVVLRLADATMPAVMWSAPVPLIGLVADYNLHWHRYRHLLPRCDLVLTDAGGASALRKIGLDNVQVARLFGTERAWLESAPEAPRDIDVLFVGNFLVTVQPARAQWLGRLAALADRWHVVISTEGHGEQYCRLLRRSRIVFNDCVGDECNNRAFEAAGAGALLFQEAGNTDVEVRLGDRREYVAFTSENLEALLDYYLEHEDKRRKIAAAAREKLIPGETFATQWEKQLAQLGAAWPNLAQQAALRSREPLSWQRRVWQALPGCPGDDPHLAEDLQTILQGEPNNADMHNAMGVVLASQALRSGKEVPLNEIIGCFQQAAAADASHFMAGLNLAEALLGAGHHQQAIAACRLVLDGLRGAVSLRELVCNAVRYPPNFDHFRVEWERAGWLNAGRPPAEGHAKLALLRWRLHTLLASLTGELSHYYDAVVERPDLPPTRAALGCALGRAGQLNAAVRHLEEALLANPFDGPAATALRQAYTALGDSPRLRRLARDRRRLAKAAPTAVPVEDWFRDSQPVGDELASLIILCCNQFAYTRECLESVLQYTRQPYELIVVDNASTDETPAYLEELKGRSGPARVVVIRNDSNLGFAKGCNQGLEQARGQYLVLLNNDTVVTAGWLDGLVAWSVHKWPKVGLVGPMTSWAPPPQQIPTDYRTPAELQAFAVRRRQEFAGQATKVQRLIGFCMLFRRDVWERLGKLDEDFGIGFFEDDDLSVRAREAGFHLVMALDVFIHHYGNRTFQGLGIDARAQLEANFEKFRAKWGDERCAGYRLFEDGVKGKLLGRAPE